MRRPRLAGVAAALLAAAGALPNYFGSLSFGHGVKTSPAWAAEKRSERICRADWAIQAATQKRARKGAARWAAYYSGGIYAFRRGSR